MNKPKDKKNLLDNISYAVANYVSISNDDSFTEKVCITVENGWVKVSEDND